MSSPSQKFDYLIVGGGTAGITLAARLSEDPNVVVGVIEAGDYVTDVMSIMVPGMARMAHGGPLDWSFYTVEQEGAHNRKIFEPRGKIVGGSTALNYMAWGRASSKEYDALEALGNPGWNWKELLPYFKKVEGFVEPPASTAETFHAGGFSTEFHGTTGPIKKSFSHYFNPLHLPFLKAATNLGVPMNLDTGSGNNYGTFTGAFNVDPETSTRSYAATAYYAPNKDRKNLVLISKSQATRIIFEQAADGEYIATGVEFVKDGKTSVVSASKEVILSAGSYQTPQLLELSGIGTKPVLDKFGIKQLVELPVGKNLQDHAWVPYMFQVPTQFETLDVLADQARLGQEIALYQEKQRGMLSSVFSAFSFLPFDKVFSSEQHAKFNKALETDPSFKGLEKQHAYLKKWLQDPKHAHIELLQIPAFFSISDELKPVPGNHYHTIMVGILHPLSRGSVHIASADPLAPPAIDPAYLKNPLDLDALVGGMRFVERLSNTAPYSHANGGAFDPSPEVLKTDAALGEFVKAKIEPFYHPVATASMLPREDGGVVDSKLKVYGTKNLRVADASVIPVQISAHIQSTVYAIAEKAADIIKAAA